jgi:creatinine amidohydrolase
VLTDIRSIAATGWYGSPQNATAENGKEMIDVIAQAISKECSEIFDQLDKVEGGTAEFRQSTRRNQ